MTSQSLQSSEKENDMKPYNNVKILLEILENIMKRAFLFSIQRITRIEARESIQELKHIPCIHPTHSRQEL